MENLMTKCGACEQAIEPTHATVFGAASGVSYHPSCVEAKHTFYAVDFDGDGGPGFHDRAGAEAFIREEVENHNDPDITAALFEIKPFVMTWAEFEALGEWDGY